MKKYLSLIAGLALLLSGAGHQANACTGIALNAKDGSRVLARTVEWAATPINCGYAVVPRGHSQVSMTPKGEDGLRFDALYGYVGIYTDYEPFVVEGVNEAGLSAGLFFFPGFGEQPAFEEELKARSLCDMQLVSWVLSQFSTIDEVKEGLANVQVISIDKRMGTVHWRLSEPGGRTVVLEFKGGDPVFYENPLGVLTNAPGFDWHMTNLRNYVNLAPGAAANQTLAEGLELSPLGGGSAMLGLPGDFTPPSRFIRAAFFSACAPQWANGFESVMQAFHILNNFDIPIGAQHKAGQAPAGLPSATQFTAATDLASLKFYYRTAWNQNIRCIDLKTIDFRRVKYRTAPLDSQKQQPVESLAIK